MRSVARVRKLDPKACAQLEQVILPNAQLGDRWVESFASLMTEKLRTLDLSGNRMSKLAITALFKSLTHSLRNLTIKGVNLSKCFHDCICPYITSHRFNLLRLNLAEVRLGNPNCAHLCHALSEHATVTDLDLTSNMISLVGCEAMAKMMEKVRACAKKHTAASALRLTPSCR